MLLSKPLPHDPLSPLWSRRACAARYGPRGYFRGFAAQWARFGPFALVQFVCWEQLRLVSGLPGI